MTSKLSIVTGASGGIGLETATGLARQNYHVVMIVRNADKGEAARKKIWAAAPDAKVDMLLADFASLASVREAVAAILARYDRIGVLVNNAGLIERHRVLSKDGYEMTFAVNHLAPFLMTNLLLDRLKQSGAARIVNVSSIAHQGSRLDFDDLQTTRDYGMMKAYGRSKLANILFTRELADRLKGTDVTANSLHPGIVATGFFDRFMPGRIALKLASPFVLSPAKGAETSIYLATSPEVEGITGRYFAKSAEAKTSEAAQNKDDAIRLWDASAKLAGL